MALILEVLDPQTGAVRARLRLDAPAFTLGRGFGNDLILDDPYVDARHARITRTAEGEWQIEDLGSLNGLIALRTAGGPDTVLPDSAMHQPNVPVHPGTQVRLGRTTLRFRDPDEPVAEALRDLPEPAPSAGFTARWLATSWVRLGLPAFALGTIALYTWLHSFERSSGSDAFTAGLVFLFGAALWAGVWSVASRIVVHRFHFLEHLAVISGIVLAGLASMIVSEWAAFLFPDNMVLSPLGGGLMLLTIAALVAGHLALSSTMTRRRRWNAGMVTSGVLLVLGLVATLAADDTFSDVPEFPGVLKPFRAQWLPAGTIDGFSRAVADLKIEVDEIVEKQK